MLRALGALLLFGGCISVGRTQVQLMNRRINTLQSLMNALEIIERELGFRMLPMEDLFSAASQRAAEPTFGFLRMCEEGLKQELGRPLDEIWCRAAKEKLADLKENEMECILSLGAVLGRYDEEGQRQAIHKTREALAQSLLSAVNERRSKGKVYSAMGATAGAFLVILLL